MIKWISVIVLAILSIFGCRSDKPSSSTEAYLGLRNMILNTNQDSIGVHVNKDECYGILMDYCIDDVPITLVAMKDGTTSLYFGNGGGIIGAGQHDVVRMATLDFINLVQKYLPATEIANDYPPAEKQQVIFYFMTHEGKRKITEQESKLVNGESTISALFIKAQEIITLIRQTTDNLEKKNG
jgi:hypothetical protein